MAGMQAGEERTFEFDFPLDWHVEPWRGERASATLKVRELFEWDLPQYDDAFVAEHYPAFSSADDMRSSLLATTAMERFKATQREAADRIMEAVAASVDVDIPHAYLMAVAEREFQEKLLRMISDGVATPEQVEGMATEEGLTAFVEER